MYTERYAKTFPTNAMTQQAIIQNFSSYNFEKSEVSMLSWRKMRNLIFLYLYLDLYSIFFSLKVFKKKQKTANIYHRKDSVSFWAA